MNYLFFFFKAFALTKCIELTKTEVLMELAELIETKILTKEDVKGKKRFYEGNIHPNVQLC